MDQVVAPPTSLLTHIALPVRDLEATLAFYRRYTTLEVIHERDDARPSCARRGWPTRATRPTPATSSACRRRRS